MKSHGSDPHKLHGSSPLDIEPEVSRHFLLRWDDRIQRPGSRLERRWQLLTPRSLLSVLRTTCAVILSYGRS